MAGRDEILRQRAPERRQSQLAELRQAWIKEYPLQDVASPASRPAESQPAARVPSQVELDQVQRRVLELSGDRADGARESLAGLGPDLALVLETLVDERELHLPQAIYRDLLRKQGDDFEALDALDSTSVEERRRAASRLARLAAENPLRPLVVARISELGCKESDVVVCRTLIAAVEGDRSSEAVQLLSAAASHPSAEIRRLAIEQLGRQPRPEQTPVFMPALQDDDVLPWCEQPFMPWETQG